MTGLLAALISGATGFFTKMLLGMCSEKLLAKIFFAIADKFAAMTTKVDFDDKLVSIMKSAYYGTDNSEQGDTGNARETKGNQS